MRLPALPGPQCVLGRARTRASRATSPLAAPPQERRGQYSPAVRSFGPSSSRTISIPEDLHGVLDSDLRAKFCQMSSELGQAADVSRDNGLGVRRYNGAGFLLAK